MRQRKRDWPQRVYDYAVVLATLPEEFWTIVHQQRDHWQRLAALHESCRQAVEQAIKDQQPKAMLAAMRQIIWGYKDPETKKHVAGIWNDRTDEIIAELHWEYGDDLLDRFNASCTRARKEKLGRYPRPERRSRSARLMHRFTGGGKSFTELATTRGWRCRIPRLGLGTHPVEFGVSESNHIFAQVHFHRLPSPDAVVKRVVFCGSYSRAFKWQWRFQITVEEAPPTIPSASTGRIAAIDLGWRKMGDYIRIGYLADSDGQEIELRLPLPDAFRRPHHQRSRSRKSLAVSLDDVEKLQALKDVLKDQCKTQLAAIANGGILGERTAYFDKTGIRGLERLRRDLEIASEHPEAQQIIAQMVAEYDKLNRQTTAFQERNVRRRRWLYGNLIAWLKTRYDQVVLEDAFSIKEMTEAPDLGYGLKGGVRYERLAAIGELRAGIIRATSIVEGERKNSTLKHWTCGNLMSASARLELTCEQCGTRIDRDRNAAINLITQTSGLSTQDWGLRNSSAYRARQVIEIPSSLKAVAFLVLT